LEMELEAESEAGAKETALAIAGALANPVMEVYTLEALKPLQDVL